MISVIRTRVTPAMLLGMILAGLAAAQQPAAVPVPNPAETPGQAPNTAQTPVAGQPANQGPTGLAPEGGLKVVVLSGNTSTNINLHETVVPVVEIRDQDDRPLEGAKVEFQLPLTGPSGAFEGGVRNLTATTNVQGQASAPYVPNNELGRFTIQVKATLGTRTGSGTITARNANESEPVKGPSKIGSHKKLIIVAAVLTAGAIVGIVLATRGGGGGNGGGNPTLTISPGVPTVGAPH